MQSSMAPDKQSKQYELINSKRDNPNQQLQIERQSLNEDVISSNLDMVDFGLGSELKLSQYYTQNEM